VRTGLIRIYQDSSEWQKSGERANPLKVLPLEILKVMTAYFFAVKDTFNHLSCQDHAITYD
jgi:lipopolysaccharide biosynthesis regulator YciM